MNEELERI